MRRAFLLAGLLWRTPAALAEQNRWELGLGTRDSMSEAWHAEGLRLTGRRLFAPWALELGLYGSPFTERVRDRDLEIAQYAAGSTFQQPVELDLATVSLLADWGVQPREQGRRISGGPHLYAGLEGRRMLQRYTHDCGMACCIGMDLVESEPHWGGGPVLGMGFQLQLGAWAGARLAFYDRMRIGLEPLYDIQETSEDLELQHDFTAAFDLLAAF